MSKQSNLTHSQQAILDKNNQIRTYRVMVLALSAFVFNTTEFIPIALLSDIGESFNQSATQTGIMMTVYAWIVALLSLPAMLITAKMERKFLLLLIFFVFVVSHLVTVFSPNFTILLISRAGVALSHAIFWSITASLVVRLAPKNKQTMALGMLATGSALATILGLPLGRLLGQSLGWQATFLVIGSFGLLCMLIIAQILPKLPSKNAGSLASLPKGIENKTLLIIYLLTMLGVTAHFSAYSYIEPFMIHINQFTANTATTILLVFGVSGMLASMIFGKFYEKFQQSLLPLSFFGLCLCLALMAISKNSLITWGTLVIFWGISITLISLILQIRTLKSASNYTDVAMSLFSGIYNIGIGGGALLGGIIINYAGLINIGYAAFLISLLCLIIWFFNRFSHLNIS